VIGGAWPFFVRGVICLLNCVSENRFLEVLLYGCFCLATAFFTFCSFGSICLKTVVLGNFAIVLSPCNLEGNERDRNLLFPLFHLLMDCCLVILSFVVVMGISRVERKLEGPPIFFQTDTNASTDSQRS
jgi:hypothetical protein